MKHRFSVEEAQKRVAHVNSLVAGGMTIRRACKAAPFAEHQYRSWKARLKGKEPLPFRRGGNSTQAALQPALVTLPVPLAAARTAQPGLVILTDYQTALKMLQESGTV